MSDPVLPIVDNESRPFWEGAKAHRLMLQQCRACQKYIWYPRTLCTHCYEDALVWKEVSGEGTLYTYTIARRAAGPAFADKVPYAVGLIDLKEGARMMANLVADDLGTLRIGQAVRVVFEDITDEVTYPKFQVVF